MIILIGKDDIRYMPGLVIKKLFALFMYSFINLHRTIIFLIFLNGKGEKAYKINRQIIIKIDTRMDNLC